MDYGLIIDSTLYGFITFVIGTILFNLTINRNNKYNAKPYGINLSFFATGFFIFIISEILRLNKNFF